MNWTKLYNVDMPWRGHTLSVKEQNIMPLYYAARLSNHAIWQALLEAGKNPDEECGLFGIPLQTAAYDGDVRLVMLLIDAGASVTSNCGMYHSALHAATSQGHEEVAKILLNKGANVNERLFSKKGSAFTTAAREGHTSVCKLLLDHGVQDSYNFKVEPSSALLAAILGGHKDRVRLLLVHMDLKHGDSASKNRGIMHNASTESWSSSALAEAAEAGDYEITRMLLEAGAEMNSKDRNPTIVAASASSLAVLSLLLNYGGSVNFIGNTTSYFYNVCQHEDSPGATSLLFAVYRRKWDMVGVLIQRGPDVNRQGTHWDTTVMTPLNLATQAKKLDIMRQLKDVGANLNACDSEGFKALQEAAKTGELPLVQFLLEAGANVDAQTKEGFAALHLTARDGHADILDMLLYEYGANMMLRLQNGSQPVHSAAC